MKKTVFSLLTGLLLSFNGVAADTYTVDPRHTFPGFEINHLGFSIQRGRFDKTSGRITLDREAATGSVDIVIDAASISTGLAELEEHLRGQDFFDVARFPTVSFSSSKLIFAQDKLIGVDGSLSLHGLTRPVHLNVDHFYCALNPIAMKNVCGANATTTLKRSDFGIDKYVPLLADDVKIVIQIEAIKD